MPGLRLCHEWEERQQNIYCELVPHIGQMLSPYSFAMVKKRKVYFLSVFISEQNHRCKWCSWLITFPGLTLLWKVWTRPKQGQLRAQVIPTHRQLLQYHHILLVSLLHCHIININSNQCNQGKLSIHTDMWDSLVLEMSLSTRIMTSCYSST